jgi:hypothetical protein
MYVVITLLLFVIFSRGMPSSTWASRDVSKTVGVNRHLNKGKEVDTSESRSEVPGKF